MKYEVENDKQTYAWGKVKINDYNYCWIDIDSILTIIPFSLYSSKSCLVDSAYHYIYDVYYMWGPSKQNLRHYKTHFA